MEKVIDHFIAMEKLAADSLDDGINEMGDWHRGLYSGYRGAYDHCIKYLRRYMATQPAVEPDAEKRAG